MRFDYFNMIYCNIFFICSKPQFFTFVSSLFKFALDETVSKQSRSYFLFILILFLNKLTEQNEFKKLQYVTRPLQGVPVFWCCLPFSQLLHLEG